MNLTYVYHVYTLPDFCFFSFYSVNRFEKGTKHVYSISKTYMDMFVHAPCKINITLDVFDKKERMDGYHNLDSIVIPFGEPADELRIRIEPASERNSIVLTCDDPRLPLDNRNLAYRAAEIYLAQLDKPFRIEIDLKKRVPSEAGLGGGSSDAAAVLRVLNTYFNDRLDRSTMITLAARLGGDVPLFLAEKPVRMRGCGDILEPLDFELPAFWGVLVHPGTGVSTARAYALLDAIANRQVGTSTEKLLSRLHDDQRNPIHINELLTSSMSNDFESVILSAYPDVAKVSEMILSAGALRALLCGSGSAVFGLAHDMQHAKQLVDTLTVQFPFVTLVSNTSSTTFQIEQLDRD